MKFTAIPRQVREGDGRLEVLFQGRPAYYWTTDPGLRPLVEEALGSEQPLEVVWDPVTGQITGLSTVRL